jgi:flavin reductase
MSNWNASSTWGDPMTAALRAEFLEGMSRAATFVAVATTDGEAGRYGVTISSLTSVSADGDHPSLLACIHHLSPAAAAILKNRAFCANLLHEDQKAVSDLFAGRGQPGDHAARFDRAAWTPGPHHQPMIDGATAAFECRLATALLWETHYIIVGRVTHVALSDSPAALLYGQRAYRRAVHLPPADP